MGRRSQGLFDKDKDKDKDKDRRRRHRVFLGKCSLAISLFSSAVTNNGADPDKLILREFTNLFLPQNITHPFWSSNKMTISQLNQFFQETVGVEVEAIDVTKDIEPDPELNETLEKYTDVVEGKMGEVLGEFKCDLDGRFSSVRTKETNLGNLVSCP